MQMSFRRALALGTLLTFSCTPLSVAAHTTTLATSPAYHLRAPAAGELQETQSGLEESLGGKLGRAGRPALLVLALLGVGGGTWYARGVYDQGRQIPTKPSMSAPIAAPAPVQPSTANVEYPYQGQRNVAAEKQVANGGPNRAGMEELTAGEIARFSNALKTGDTNVRIAALKELTTYAVGATSFPQELTPLIAANRDGQDAYDERVRLGIEIAMPPGVYSKHDDYSLYDYDDAMRLLEMKRVPYVTALHAEAAKAYGIITQRFPLIDDESAENIEVQTLLPGLNTWLQHHLFARPVSMRIVRQQQFVTVMTWQSDVLVTAKINPTTGTPLVTLSGEAKDQRRVLYIAPGAHDPMTLVRAIVNVCEETEEAASWEAASWSGVPPQGNPPEVRHRRRQKLMASLAEALEPVIPDIVGKVKAAMTPAAGMEEDVPQGDALLRATVSLLSNDPHVPFSTETLHQLYQMGQRVVIVDLKTDAIPLYVTSHEAHLLVDKLINGQRSSTFENVQVNVRPFPQNPNDLLSPPARNQIEPYSIVGWTAGRPDPLGTEVAVIDLKLIRTFDELITKAVEQWTARSDVTIVRTERLEDGRLAIFDRYA